MTERERLGDEAYVRKFYVTSTQWLDDGGVYVEIMDGLSFYSDDLSKAYKKGADFTEQREREIAEKEEEIKAINCYMIADDADVNDWGRLVGKRILAQFEGRLAELKKGMR